MKPVAVRSSKQWQPALVWLTYGVGLLPALWSFYLGATGRLGADPVKAFEHSLGLWALRFLILTLAVTPIRDLAGWNFLRYRRALGLLCFYYVVFHFAVYLILDQGLNLKAVLRDTLTRPFIMFGMIGLVLLIPLALTSNKLSIRNLGKNWIRLHRAVYVVAAAAVLHFALSTKVWTLEQLIYISVILGLLLYRSLRPIIRDRKPPGRRARAAQAAS